MLKKSTLNKISNYKLEKTEFETIFQQNLSYNQESLLYISELEKGFASYNVPYIRKLKDNVDVVSLKKAIEELVRRHKILSTIIKDNNNVYYTDQIKDKKFKVNINEYDSFDDLYSGIHNHLVLFFDLNHDYPLKANINVCKDCKILSLVFNNIATDEFSNRIINTELKKLYKYYKNNEEIYPLENLDVQYHDFAYLQKNTLEKKEFDKQFKYFNEHLKDYNDLDLPLDKIRPNIFDYKGNEIKFEVNIGTLQGFLKDNDISLHNFTLFIYFLLLYRYSNCDDVVVGSEIANRHISGTEKLIGFFANTQVIRFIFNQNKTIKELLSDLSTVTDAHQINQDLPFNYFVDRLGVERDLSKNPIFQAYFIFQNITNNNEELIYQGDVTGNENIMCLFDSNFSVVDFITDLYDCPSYAKFDLTLTVTEEDDMLSFSFNYATSLFEEDTIKHLVDLYENMINIVVDNVNVRFSDLDFLSLQEKNSLLDLNDTFVDNNPEDKTVIDLFEENVQLNPNNIAIVYKNEKLTYKELNICVNKLASYLMENYDLGVGFFVPLVFDRSPYMIIAILSVLKCGSAYVPLSPNYPKNRIKHILSDIGSEVILTDNQSHRNLDEVFDNDKSLTIVDIKSLFVKDILDDFSSLNLYPDAGLDDVVQVIYTSGSGGKPKGVVIEHKSLYNFVVSLFHIYEFEIDESMLFFHDYIFIASVKQIFLPLITSSKLIISYDNLWQNESEFINYSNENNVTHASLTPSFAKQIDMRKVKSLKRLVLLGEKVDNELIKKYANQKFKLINGFGSTETTGIVTYKEHTQEEIETLSIGKPISNTTCYVMDDNHKLLPKGSIGELHVGGIGLARNYLNNPELTNEKFISNPYQTIEQKDLGFNGKLYRTGDLVRLNSDNDFEYIGRADFQVKIRGYRVELEEIENILTKIKGIKHAIVLLDEDRLVAYYQSDKVSDDNIRNELINQLPNYMIPNIFYRLDEIPLNDSGKVDINRLPKITISKSADYQKPKTSLEWSLVEIWADILKIDIDLISVVVDFFYIGGNSILAIVLANKINELFNKSINTFSIFNNPTIKKQVLLLLNDDNMDYDYKKIIEYQKGKENNTRLIFVHPGGGGAESYSMFSKLLDKNIPFYSVDNYNLKHGDNKLESIECIAKEYITYLNDASLLENNNFIFGGWSLGGVLAFEMAYQLEMMGLKPKKILIFDGYLEFNEFLHGEKAREFYIERLKEGNIDEDSEFFEMALNSFVNDVYNMGKMVDVYTPKTPITIDSVYYLADIKMEDWDDKIDDNGKLGSKEFHGFKEYLLNVSLVHLNTSHWDMFISDASLLTIADSIEKIYMEFQKDYLI